MSAKLVKKILDSALDPRLKQLATAMVTYGNDDGTSIFPSIGRLAWQLGQTERHIKRGIAGLRAQQILIIDDPLRKPGQHRPVRYRFDAAALPARPDWESAPFLRPLTTDLPTTRSAPKTTRLSPPISGDMHVTTTSLPSGDLHVTRQVTPMSPEAGCQVTFEARSGDTHVTLPTKYLRSTNTSTDAVAPVSPTTTERRRKPAAKIPPTFATLQVFVADFLKRAEPALSDPDLVEDIRNACQRTFDTYDTAEIWKALETCRHNEQRGTRRVPSRMTRIADLMPPALGRR